MLPTPTRFPAAGSFAMLKVPVPTPRGRTGVRLRCVRIQQVNRDGSLFVTADAVNRRFGAIRVALPAIQMTVYRSDLVKPRRDHAAAMLVTAP